MKKILTSVTAVLLLLCLFAGCQSNYIDGNEWLRRQQGFLDDMQAFSNGMDEVYTLYFIGSIGPGDFTTEVQLLEKQYMELRRQYKQAQQEHPVKEGTHSYISKRGVDAIEEIYDIFEEIIDMTFDDSGNPQPPDKMTIIYLAEKEKVVNEISVYLTACSWLDKADRENESSKAVSEAIS